MIVERLPITRRWEARRQRRLIEGLRFLLVGGMNYVVDVGVFNALRATVMATQPVSAKVISATVATLFSWVVNRSWTFSTRARRRMLHEFIGFMVINALGLVPPVVCLWFSHYVLGFESQLADNISANIIGVALGTLVRYLGYSLVVFNPKPKSTD
ncbi:MAG: GtrA family protein [Actinomycetaceae bacterium]|nr:GtrA family protein [Actinomycetaceae bacterium]